MSAGEGGIAAAGDPSPFAWACAEPRAGSRYSSIGRPRRLTDQQVASVLAEYARYLAWRALRSTVKSQRQLAKELGVSQATISLAIRSRGQYKQRPPELRTTPAPRGRRPR